MPVSQHERTKPTKSKARSQVAVSSRGSRAASNQSAPQIWDPALDLSLVLAEVNPRWGVNGPVLLSGFVYYILPTLVDDLVALHRGWKSKDPCIAGDSADEGDDILLAIAFLLNPAESFGRVPTMKVCWLWLRANHFYLGRSWATVDRRLRRITQALGALSSRTIPGDSDEARLLMGRYPLAHRFYSPSHSTTPLNPA